MERIHSARAIQFGEEILVEVLGRDEHGAVDVVSYQFSSNDDGRGVTPREPVADDHVSVVLDALVEDELDWIPEQADSRQ